MRTATLAGHGALIVDDERLARREMRTLLEADGRVHVTAEAANLAEARLALERLQPDLVFLDIKLGRQNGFDLLDHVAPGTEVVFVTAYDAHAIRAFDVNALDYLLKPVDPARLARTLDRFETRHRRPAGHSPRARLKSEDWLFLRQSGRPVFVPIKALTHITADGDFTVLHIEDGRDLRIHTSLRHWEERLPPPFLRIHRAVIVNLERVTRVEPWSHHTYRVFVRGAADALPMSRRHAAKAMAILG